MPAVIADALLVLQAWRNVAPLRIVFASLTLFCSCLWGATLLAERQGIQDAKRRAADMAVGVLGTVEQISAQINDTMQGVRRGGDAEARCSADDLARLQAVQARYSYIGVIARVSGAEHRVLCSTAGHAVDGVQLGPPDYARGSRKVHRRTVLKTLGGTEYFVISDGGTSVFIHSSVAMTILSTLQDASLGAYIRNGGPRIFSRGLYDLAAIQALERSGRPASFDGQRLRAVARSESTDYAAFVEFPPDRVVARIDEARAFLLPLGGLLGAALSTLLFFFLRDRTSMAASLGRALGSERVFMAYQPIVDLQTGRCVGAEALVRWQRGGRLVPPDRFIVAAERAGIMPRVTRRVVELVARDMADFLRTHPDQHVSINFSALDLRSGQAPELLAELLRVTGLPPASFWIEITETGFVEEDAGETIDRIRSLGIRVAVDDFGTGYANLSVLDRLTVDLLKIDQRFVQSISETGEASEVILAIIGLARSISLEMVAEGVETQFQADFLRRHGVQYAQGWLFGKPGPVAALRALIDAPPAGHALLEASGSDRSGEQGAQRPAATT